MLAVNFQYAEMKWDNKSYDMDNSEYWLWSWKGESIEADGSITYLANNKSWQWY